MWTHRQLNGLAGDPGPPKQSLVRGGSGSGDHPRPSGGLGESLDPAWGASRMGILEKLGEGVSGADLGIFLAMSRPCARFRNAIRGNMENGHTLQEAVHSLG